MKDKQNYIVELKILLEFGKQRKTSQGILLYETFIKKIENSSTHQQIEKLIVELEQSLAGIEAHGYFTAEEFECVKKIRGMNDGY